ncbi:MAG: DUF4252 domain-containing protein [Saprospiraceae bacterium]|nr:DUF4252 domain-containing protein [Saprospiraceae bacterium]MCB0574306.1 DUF4252 domain-containing protein [Saprospiraceae bacterium]MCB9356501.1 DUF4252 domain-containing protein [Lewinellaceae bacterium]
MKKNFLLVPVFLLTALFAQAQNDAITRFFEKYMDDERFTVVYVAPKMFQLVSKIETDDEDWNKVREIVKDLGGLRVLTADSIGDGIAIYKDALSRVPQSEYSELLTVRDGNENVRIWTKDSGNIIEELLLLVGSPDEFVMLSFTGKIDLDKISELSKTLDVKGIEQLERVKKDKN